MLGSIGHKPLSTCMFCRKDIPFSIWSDSITKLFDGRISNIPVRAMQESVSCNSRFDSKETYSFVHLANSILDALSKGERFFCHLFFEIYDRPPISMLTFFIHLSWNSPLGSSSKPYCRFPTSRFRQLAMISPTMWIESIPSATLSAVRTSNLS